MYRSRPALCGPTRHNRHTIGCSACYWVSRVPRSLENLTWHYDWQMSASKSSFSVKLSIEKFATDAFRVTQPVDPWSNDQELERGRKKISLAFKWDLFDQNRSRTAFRGIYYVHMIGSVWRTRYYADLLGTTNCTTGCNVHYIAHISTTKPPPCNLGARLR